MEGGEPEGREEGNWESCWFLPPAPRIDTVAIMPELVPWSDFSDDLESPPQKGPARFLKLSDGRIHTVRFVGNPVRYFGYCVNKRVAICADPESCPFRAKYKIDPTMRYAANVL